MNFGLVHAIYSLPDFLCSLRILQYSSQIVETEAMSLKFSPNFLYSVFTPLFSLKYARFHPNVEPRVFWCIETTVTPKSKLGKEKMTQMFQDL